MKLESAVRTKPRMAFLGVGWIGRHRMRALWESGEADVVAVADFAPALAEEAAAEVACTTVEGDLYDLLALKPDAVVIATPTSLHAEQALACIERGIPVFCQKPLGRTESECARVVEAARRADVLLGVDLSYRRARAVEEVLAHVGEGAIGEPYAADLVFHNSYGPDKKWYRDPSLSGGGAALDLGTHLLDVAAAFFGGLRVRRVTSSLFAGGRRLHSGSLEVEDHAEAHFELEGGRVLRLSCSWWLPAGRDAVVDLRCYGSSGAVAVQNVEGSFYDFRALLFRGREERVLVEPPDDWGGRVLVDWVHRLTRDPSFDPAVEQYLEVARALDLLYRRSP